MHTLPGESPLTTWAFLHFIPAGLGPEADAVMAHQHPGQQPASFKLKVDGQVGRGLVPA